MIPEGTTRYPALAAKAVEAEERRERAGKRLGAARQAARLRASQRFGERGPGPGRPGRGPDLGEYGAEMAQRATLLAGARRGDPVAIRELWARYRCRLG